MLRVNWREGGAKKGVMNDRFHGCVFGRCLFWRIARTEMRVDECQIT
jgi:hypothetical protein